MSTGSTPLVSVLTTAYNAAATIEETVRSVQAQTLTDWEMVIVDNASSDRTVALCEAVAAGDPRIRVVRNPENLGITRSALRGIGLCRGRYLARLDADDLCHPERLEKQVEFLAANPDVKLLGTWVERITETGQLIDRLSQGPATREHYRQIRLDRQPLWVIHSSLMAEREIFEVFAYREDDFPCDDSFFWNRVALQHPVLALPDYLVKYRVSSTGAHTTYSRRICFQGVRLEYCLEHQADIGTEEFTALVRRTPSLRWRVWRTYAQKHTVRMAGLSYYKKRWVLAALYGAASVCINPRFTAQRLRTLVRKRPAAPGTSSPAELGHGSASTPSA